MKNKINEEIAVELSSSACAIRDADDGYMGYATKNEMIIFLGNLLTLEGSCTRICIKCITTSEHSAICEHFQVIQRDLLHWQSRLFLHLNTLGFNPLLGITSDNNEELLTVSANLIDFVKLFIDNLGSIVKQLEENMSRVRCDQIYNDLSHMRQSHIANISIVRGLKQVYLDQAR